MRVSDKKSISSEHSFMTGSMQRTLLELLMAVLIVILLFATYTFILQSSYSSSLLSNAQNRNKECSDVMKTLVSNKFTKDDFESIRTVEDMKKDRYKNLQEVLNELRALNSTRYLYTATRGEDGKLIYLVDGLDIDAPDFAYPGTYIEKEMIPYINSALSGETIYSQDIVDTTWGHIFTACYPVMASDESDEVVGALCVEMDMENTYTFISESRERTIGIAIVATVLMLAVVITGLLILRKRRKEELLQKEELHRAVIAADAANKAKSTFLFNMSHDIRTPMNAILGFAEIGRKNLEKIEKTDDCFTKIQISGKKMLSIIDNVLELSRIESGKTTVKEEATEVDSVIDGCITMVQPEIEKKNLKLSISKEISNPYIYMDSTLVTEIFLNIISNSIKYTKNGGSITCIARQEKAKKDGYLIQQFIISDTGIGMSEEFQKHIFEAFTRERNSTTSGIEGTGLGMGIVKKLVDMMDGTVSVKSAVGEGTTFTVSIPCRIASREDIKAPEIDSSKEYDELKGKHILMAEDNDLNAEIAITLLSEYGLIIDRAENGVVCIDMLEKANDNYYSLILMDIQMPVMDGYKTTEEIRKLPDKSRAGTPIIAMTANAFAEDRAKALNVGMNDYVVKPIDMDKTIPVLLKYIK